MFGNGEAKNVLFVCALLNVKKRFNALLSTINNDNRK